ncbi:MAG: hypothetical protein JXD22_10910 [Sedimentisphaerales bacterium]|nr:hypothetical protein [Sedimentisphaerales bacterium]
MRRLGGITVLLILIVGSSFGWASDKITVDIDAAQAVKPLAAAMLQAKPDNERSVQLAQAYYDSIAKWGEVLWDHLERVPDHDDWGYYGLGRNVEDDVRPICYAVMANAFLAEVKPPQERLTPTQRERSRTDAIMCLRYLTQAHVTGTGVCLNGKPWGDQWQSAMWCRAAGLGGWLIWEHLDASLQQAVAKMVAHEAERFIDKQPESREYRNTGAEENAWNAKVTALACNMMSEHPHAVAWDRATKTYLYNSFSVKADHEDTTIGDDGKMIKKWVTTINAHSDYTVENHGLVHMSYLKDTMGYMLENACTYQLTGKTIPRAYLHHVEDAFAVVKKCMSWDGAAIYFGGNDWKIVHSQSADVSIYAALSQLTGDKVAASLEVPALKTMSAMQREEHGFFNVRRDLEYSGFCACRLISGYWYHVLVGRDCPPLTSDDLNKRLCGVTYLETARAIVQRTPTKFASFAWGPKHMALAMPENGNWVIWPHFASYLGYINDMDSSDKQAKILKIKPELQKDGFSVIGALERCEGKVTQDFAYVSLPGDVTFYIERLQAAKDFKLESRETGVIGHEYELAKNTRTLYGDFSVLTMQGTGGEKQVHEWTSDWFNVDDKVGYVIKRSPGVHNVIRYHDEPQGYGRVPKLQEWFSLVGDANTNADVEKKTLSPDGEWTCVVTFLNQTSAATKAHAENIDFKASGDSAMCRFGSQALQVDFHADKVNMIR